MERNKKPSTTEIDILNEMNSAVDDFKTMPRINVISKEVFEQRVEQVFKQLWLVLSKSFGPYGAPTIINCYPYKHVTKDGYTIMKNLSFDSSETLLDQSIRDTVDDVCGRLNFSVGDGTTSAVISTNAIYHNYRKKKSEFDENFVMPRDVVNLFNEIKDKVISELGKVVKPIQSDDMDVLANNIRDVVYISSNGDNVITDYISDLYHTLGCPAISCELAVDGITKYSTIQGYQIDMALMDKTYINSDDDTMKLDDADIIIFSTKITKNTYEKILKPLRDACAVRKRHLIVAAPFYDETALRQTIRRDLNNEYQKTHDVTMILMVYKALSAHTRKLIEDFSILSNTLVIDKDLERSIYEQLEEGLPIDAIINLDHREIPGLLIFGHTKDSNLPVFYQRTGNTNDDTVLDNLELVELSESHIDLGYVRDISLGLKRSLFKEFFYDETKYSVALKDAATELRQLEDKYKKLGTFNLEVSLAQQRLYSLKLRMGLIEVGADSELSQSMLKDQVDDAIKAAASAFNYGVIKGCNVSLQRVIEKIKNEYKKSDQKESKIYVTLLDILLDGFTDVYKTILGNAFEDIVLIQGVNEAPSTERFFEALKDFCDKKLQRFGGFEKIFAGPVELVHSAIERAWKRFGNITVHGVIVEYSILTDQVFDVSKYEFSDKIVNSSQTDEEILKATCDLIGILIVGNQMVITQKHNFE